MDKRIESVVSSDVATEWHQTINDRFKAAFVKQWDPKLPVNVFNFEKTSRTTADFGLLPPLKNLPKFIFDHNINGEAKDILQSYLTGTYFLDPIEVYRLSYSMKRKAGQDPNPGFMSEQIKTMWEGTKQVDYGKGAWFEPTHTFRSSSLHSSDKPLRSETMSKGMQRLWRECF